MDEYISKKEALNLIEHNDRLPRFVAKIYEDIVYSTIQSTCEAIALMPAADVQPVKRGRWIDCTFYDPCEKSWEQDFEFECSNCGHKIYNKPNDNNLFCGHCSARMDGGEE